MGNVIIIQTFTMARWQNCCQEVRGNRTNQRPKQQLNKQKKTTTKTKQTNKQKTNMLYMDGEKLGGKGHGGGREIIYLSLQLM